MTTTSDRFSEFVDALDFPMFVVTTAADGHRTGCLVGFTTQVSIDPQRFLVALSKPNHTTTVALTATHVAVHLLRWDDLDLARLFGEQTGDQTDKFTRCRWSDGPEGMPVLEDAAAWFVGRIVDRIDLGDHVGHVLEPVSVQPPTSPAATITYADVKDFDPGHDA